MNCAVTIKSTWLWWSVCVPVCPWPSLWFPLPRPVRYVRWQLYSSWRYPGDTFGKFYLGRCVYLSDKHPATAAFDVRFTRRQSTVAMLMALSTTQEWKVLEPVSNCYSCFWTFQISVKFYQDGSAGSIPSRCIHTPYRLYIYILVSCQKVVVL